MIFKRVGDDRPYPPHGRDPLRGWTDVPPRVVRLQDLVTTKATLSLRDLLADDSTFYGDLFAHCVEWRGELYLEDGLHRALRAALAQRATIHARVVVLDEFGGPGHAPEVEPRSGPRSDQPSAQRSDSRGRKEPW